MVVALRRLLLLAVTATILTVIGWVDGIPHDSAWAQAPGPLPGTLQGLAVAWGWASAHPRAALVALGVVTVPVLLGRLVALIPKPVQKDPIRMFTPEQRRSGFALSGNQCEFEGLFFFSRCRRDAEHGDHWYPWSRGGPTSMENFVAACARCNTSKGAKVPTFWQTQRLAARRRKYYPAARQHQITPGARYEIPYR